MSTEFRKEIKEFFSAPKPEIQVEAFVSEMRAKVSSLMPSNMNLMPFTVEEYRQLKIDSDKISAVLELNDFLYKELKSFTKRKTK